MIKMKKLLLISIFALACFSLQAQKIGNLGTTTSAGSTARMLINANPANNTLTSITKGNLLNDVGDYLDTASVSSILVLKSDSTDGYVTPSDMTTAIAASSGSDLELAALAAMGSTIKAFNVGGGIGFVGSSANMSDSRLYIQAVYLQSAATITGVRVLQATQGNYTADAYDGVGLYSVAAGTLTLVASSTDDDAEPNIWEASSGAVISKDFSATYSAAAGLYYVALLYNSSAQTTAPALNQRSGQAGALSATTQFTGGNMLMGYIDAQNSLPATQLLSGCTSHGNGYWVAIY